MVGRGGFRFGEEAAPEEAEDVAEEHNGKEGPDDALETPPLTLEIEVFSYGDVAVDFDDGIFNGFWWVRWGP